MVPHKIVSPGIQYIFNIDSDSILLRPLKYEDLFGKQPLHDGSTPDKRTKLLPRMQRRPWSEAGEDATKAWRASTEKAIGHELNTIPYSFMVRQGALYPVWLYENVEHLFQNVHGKSLLDFHLSKFAERGVPQVSEFEILGAVAWSKYEDKFFSHNSLPFLTFLRRLLVEYRRNK